MGTAVFLGRLCFVVWKIAIVIDLPEAAAASSEEAKNVQSYSKMDAVNRQSAHLLGGSASRCPPENGGRGTV